MRFTIILLTGSLFAAAPTKLQVQGVPTAQQTILSWDQTYSGTCTIEVSESATYSPVVNDVNATLFTGSATTTAGTGSQTFIVGKRTAETASDGKIYSRSLAAGTPHYVRLTCDGEFAYLTFTTARVAGLTPEAPPWNSTGHGNVAWPGFDFTDIAKPIIDPSTGAKVYRVTDPTDRGFTQAVTFQANTVQGGSGWINMQNAASGSTGTLATTTNTNWAFIPFDAGTSRTFAGFSIAETQYSYQLANQGVRLYGSATDTSGDNGKADLCLSVDGGATCYTDVITAPSFTGSATDLGVFPSTYAQSGFIGWSKPIPAELRMSVGYVTAVASSTVTLVNARNNDGNPVTLNSVYASAAWFKPEWATGTKIYIAGTSPTCTNNLCTLVSVTDRDTIVIAETITVTEALYKSYGYGVMVRKKTATGSMSISLAHVDLGYKAMQQGQQISCSGLQVSTTKSKTGAALGYTQYGNLCLFNVVRDSKTQLYFVGTNPRVDVRLLSLIPRPGDIAGYPTDDQPETPCCFTVGPTASGLAFSTTDPNTFYSLQRTRASGNPNALWSTTYDDSLEYVEPTGIHNSYSVGGLVSGYTDPLIWANLTRQSLSESLTDQITANSTYNASLWPSLSTLQYAGLIYGYHQFYTVVNSGQNLPAAVFLFTEAGVYHDWYDTMTSGQPGARFGGLHSLLPYGTLSTWNMVSANTGVLFGGPFTATPTCVYKSGTCNANTAVSGTIGDASYDSTCPVGLPASIVALGGAAGSNQCVTLRINNEPCSATPTPAEKAAYPCPTDANKSYIGSPIAVLDGMNDAASAAVVDDDELLVIAKRTDVGSGVIELVLLRDAANGYACQVANQTAYESLRPGRRCAQATTTQANHTNGWSFYMRPRGTYQALDVASNTWSFENQWLTLGHADRSYIGSTQRYAGICCYEPSGYASRVGGSIGGPATAYFAQYPKFAGVAADDGSAGAYTQSYIASAALNASGLYTAIGGDWRHVNDGDGADPEQPNEVVGATMTFTLQGGTSAVYKVTPISGSYNPKKTQLFGWAGQYLMKEKSSASTGNTIADSDTWRFCYAYADDECRTGSTAGDVYMVIPNAETSLTRCNADQISYRSPCLIAGTTVLANSMQVRFENDADGIYQRKTGQSLTRPGAQYAYSHTHGFGDGRTFLSSVYQNEGWYSGVILVDPGPMIEDSANRTGFQPVAVKSTFADSVIEFGYDENFYCTPRAEACKVAASTINATTPFYFSSETLAGATGAATITIPAIPGRILYYRVVSGGVAGSTQKVAIP